MDWDGVGWVVGVARGEWGELRVGSWHHRTCRCPQPSPPTMRFRTNAPIPTLHQKLCTGENPDGLSYADTPIHHVVKDSAIVAGDVELKTGKGSHSALGTRCVCDEITSRLQPSAGSPPLPPPPPRYCCC